MDESSHKENAQAAALASDLGCTLTITQAGEQLLPSVVGNMAAFSGVLKASGGRWRTQARGYTFNSWHELTTALMAARNARNQLV